MKTPKQVIQFLILAFLLLAIAGSPESQDLIWGKGDPLSKEVAAFLKAGGQMLLCPHCSEHAGLTATNLRSGARIGKDGELAKTILAANKVLDY